jgi:hypothetical protein
MRTVEGRGRAAGGRVVLTVVQSGEGEARPRSRGVMALNRKPQRTGTYCDLYLCLSTILYSFRYTFQYMSALYHSQRDSNSLSFLPFPSACAHLTSQGAPTSTTPIV